MINKVILVGRITRDPELKATSSNVYFVQFSIAVNRTYTDQNGERGVDFINCVVWRRQAENLAKYVRKGALLGVEGRIQTRTYESDQGTRYITEVLADNIQFLESRSDSQATSGSGYDVNNDGPSDADQDEFYKTSQIAAEDDLPF